MWVNKGRLPLVLAPRRYVERHAHERELDSLFLPGWHCVGSTHDLPRDGDFFTTELFGRPILVRNAGGEPRAFLNVCAHRYAMLTTEARGRCERLRCQLHGWEYNNEGEVCKIPDARSFTPVPCGEERERLRRFRTEIRAGLIFVSIGEDCLPLDDALGEPTLTLIREGFGPRYRQIARWDLDHPANWKVVVENAIESYHVPMVHPGTFVVHGPQEDEDHVLGVDHTSHEDKNEAKSMIYRVAMRGLRRAPHYSYRHHHRFPSMMLALTDAMSFLHVTLPTSPTTSRSVIRLFVYKGDRGWLPGWLVSRVAGSFIRRFVGRVLAEDCAIHGAIQRGLASPEKPGPGSIGAREERVHAFQAWIASRVE